MPGSAMMKALTALREQLSESAAKGHSRRSFAAAVIVGTNSLAEHAEEFDAGDRGFQTTNIEAARQEGIMPISYVGR